MKKDVRNDACKKRGCIITILTRDSSIRPIVSRVYGTRNDIQKILPMAYLSLDKKLAQERPLEKMAA